MGIFTHRTERLINFFIILSLLAHFTSSYALISILHSSHHTSVHMCSLTVAVHEWLHTTCHCSCHREPAIILISEILSSVPFYILLLLLHCTLLVPSLIWLSVQVNFTASEYKLVSYNIPQLPWCHAIEMSIISFNVPLILVLTKVIYVKPLQSAV